MHLVSQVLGDTLEVSQSTCSRALWSVTDALLMHMNDFIRLPDGNEAGEVSKTYKHSNRLSEMLQICRTCNM
jgi:hypothetical protein